MYLEFEEYLKVYNMREKRMQQKYRHSLRVSKLSAKIGENLGLDEQLIKLASLIGLIHDVGRFTQWEKYHSFVDRKTEDHGELGVKILFDRGVIREFIKDSKYDSIIRTVIELHNKYEIPNNLDETTLMFCQIIRDADKIDILRFFAEEEPIEFTGEKKISDEVYNDFMGGKSVDLRKVKSRYDAIILWVSLMYDINYKYSFEYIQKKGYIDKLLDKIDVVPNIESIRGKTQSYIKEKLEVGHCVRKTI